MEFQDENISKMKMDILVFGNIFKRYISNVNQADAQMLAILFDLIGDIDGFIQHQHTFPTVHELEIDMRLVKCSTALSCTACLRTFGNTYQSYTNHMRVCKPAKKIITDPAPTNAVAKKATKIVIIPRIAQREVVLPPLPRERRNSTISNSTTNSSKSSKRIANKSPQQNTQPKNRESSSNKSECSSIATSSVATNRNRTKNNPTQTNVITQIFNSNTNTATTASTVTNSVLRRDSSDSQLSLPAPPPKPQIRAENPFKIPSPDSVLGFQESLKISVDSIQKTLSEISISSVLTAVSDDIPNKSAPVSSETSAEGAESIAATETSSVYDTTSSSVYDTTSSSVTSENANSEVDDINSNEDQLLKALTDFNKCKPIN